MAVVSILQRNIDDCKEPGCEAPRPQIFGKGSLTGQLLYSNDFSNTYYHPVASHIQCKNPVFTGTVYILSVLYYSLDTDHQIYSASSGLEVQLY